MTTLLFHKPYGVLSRFTPDGSSWRPLSGFGFPKGVWPVGRLDADSEGMLLLSADKRLVSRLLHPARGHRRIYWAQVERIPDAAALNALQGGVLLDGVQTLPARARLLDPQPAVPPRDPPIRFRKNVPDCWIELALVEGKNRQVRRMTAAVGHPTLRLLRTAIGTLRLGELAAGEFRALDEREVAQLFE